MLEQARELEVDEEAVRELEARASEALLEALRLEQEAILLLREDAGEKDARIEAVAEQR